MFLYAGKTDILSYIIKNSRPIDYSMPGVLSRSVFNFICSLLYLHNLSFTTAKLFFMDLEIENFNFVETIQTMGFWV